MKRLWVKLFSEGDYLICRDRDSTKAMYVAFNIIPRSDFRMRLLDDVSNYILLTYDYDLIFGDEEFVCF
jgi:hypothetical protein